MLLVSLWLFVGARVIGYPFTEPSGDAHLTEILVGVVVLLVAVARLVHPRGRMSDILVLVGGAWLIVAPFLFGYGDTEATDAARVNDVTVGSLLVLLAALSLALTVRTQSRARERADR
ncbi:SPW repeat domain-containing protein [Streptomyces wuyuanensis]|uniref:SPW repeat domain-containing protein n=1 Tax=Streptomyces wuyuanensis TaxID=1196353 RepID=UPI003D7632C7